MSIIRRAPLGLGCLVSCGSRELSRSNAVPNGSSLFTSRGRRCWICSKNALILIAAARLSGIFLFPRASKISVTITFKAFSLQRRNSFRRLLVSMSSRQIGYSDIRCAI
ncbi:hypothetical protein BJX66DRAFT_318931 [Aspergillus keveii]|uniref:Secreted protein n=1 Tax=Aspergillus keveii TaxID=714993 RepID=A0ABR4FJ26_9EURO